MTKAKPTRRAERQRGQRSAAKDFSEDCSQVAVTVAWMLTLVCSLIAHLAALTALAVTRLGPVDANSARLAAITAGALLLAALVTGILCLLLTPVIWRLRTTKPPPPIVAVAVVVGIAPVVTWVVLSWMKP